MMLAVLCSCAAKGEPRDQRLLKAGVAAYLEAKYGPNVFGMRHSLLERSKALFEDVLSDDAASAKSKREAADMLNKVNNRLAGDD